MYMLQSYWIAGTCGVGGGAVAGEVVGELQLRQLDALVHHQGRVVLGEPLKHQVLRGVRHWNNFLIENVEEK